MSRPYSGGVVVAELVRSGFVEGRHHGSVVVLGPDGSVLSSAGDADGAVFPRSSNKPMQALAMLRCGFDPREPEDLSLAAGSHWGEPFHVARVRSMLAGAGLTEDALRCPPDWPLDESARLAVVADGIPASPVYMNCSGKHAAMLVTCQAAGWPLDDYCDSGHPIQRACAQALTDLAGEPVAAIGVDGCGAPVMAVSLTGLARAFLRLVSAPDGTVPNRVATAMRTHPELMSGTGREDAALMRGVPGLLAKVGAEGVHAVAVAGVGAVAVKIDDGAARGRLVALTAGLRRLGIVAPVVDELAHQVVLGGGEPVGAVRPTIFS